MPDLIEYKCPCCMGKIEFDSTSQKMKCPFCGSEFDLETLRSYDEALTETSGESNMEWEESAGSEWEQGEAENLRVYKCQSCGGEVVADQTTAASKCPYCDNPVIMTGQFSGDLKPDLVIPFKLNKEQAKAAPMTAMSMRRSAIRHRKSAHGAIRISAIPRSTIIRSSAAAHCPLKMCRLTARRKWTIP